MVQYKGIERDIEYISFEGFDQVRFEGSIGVSEGSLNTSYQCAKGAQSNFIWVMRF